MPVLGFFVPTAPLPAFPFRIEIYPVRARRSDPNDEFR
jgi:hypothetical protein